MQFGLHSFSSLAYYFKLIIPVSYKSILKFWKRFYLILGEVFGLMAIVVIKSGIAIKLREMQLNFGNRN